MAIPPPANDYTALIDSLIGNLDKTRIPSGILYDRVVGLFGLDSHTETAPSSGSHFFQSYLDLSTAAYSKPTKLFPYTQMEMHATVAEQLRAGQLPVGVLDVRFAVLDTLAEERGTIVESGGLYYDGALALMEKNYADASSRSTFQNAYWQHNVNTWTSFDAHGPV